MQQQLLQDLITKFGGIWKGLEFGGVGIFCEHVLLSFKEIPVEGDTLLRMSAQVLKTPADVLCWDVV